MGLRSSSVPSEGVLLYQTLWLKSTGFRRSMVLDMALTIDMPVVTDVMARNKIIEMMAIEKETVLTLAESWRSVKAFSPLQ